VVLNWSKANSIQKFIKHKLILLSAAINVLITAMEPPSAHCKTSKTTSMPDELEKLVGLPIYRKGKAVFQHLNSQVVKETKLVLALKRGFIRFRFASLCRD